MTTPMDERQEWWRKHDITKARAIEICSVCQLPDFIGFDTRIEAVRAWNPVKTTDALKILMKDGVKRFGKNFEKMVDKEYKNIKK